MINVFIAIASIVLCFPLGVLLALGRRSSCRWCDGRTVYIEVFRGSPLFVLLLHGQRRARVLRARRRRARARSCGRSSCSRCSPPPTWPRSSAAACSRCPRGRRRRPGRSACRPRKVTFLIVLPQALRNVIPAQVGQFISLFKDITLAGAAMGVFELLDVGRATSPKQAEFRGQRLDVETLAFVGLLFWIGSYTMSRESQRLERRLGVGKR